MQNSRINNNKAEETLSLLLARKQLNANLFTDSSSIEFATDISVHASWLYTYIYSVPYCHHVPLPEAGNSTIARYYHGITHTSRVAYCVTVWANLYRRYQDCAAQQLTDEDVKLLQIAALFHDSARENENVDYWDQESALLCYHYLTKKLAINPSKAKLLAEAIANKDADDTHPYLELIEEDGDLIWKQNLSINNKNIYQKIIHDADCLDIIRGRPHFDATYLDFYKYIASNENNHLALEEMAHLIMEERSLIAIHGDTYHDTNPEIKQQYENENCYHLIQKDITNYFLLSSLGQRLLPIEELCHQQLIDLTPFNHEAGLTNENLYRAMREGKILVRGIRSPSYLTESRQRETFAGLELRKLMRRKKVTTQSGYQRKKGNPLRSTSIIGYGADTFTNAGLMVIDYDPRAISDVSMIDSSSGTGKKIHLAINEKVFRPPANKIQADLQELLRQLKLGGKSAEFGSHEARHTEILYDMTTCQAIFYSEDPNLYNQDELNSRHAMHKHSPLLQAIFIQKQYEIEYQKTRENFINIFGEVKGIEKFEKKFGKIAILPIVKYSGIHNTINLVPPSEMTEEKIIEMWVEMCINYFKKFLLNKPLQPETTSDNEEKEIESLKILSMYKKSEYHLLNPLRSVPLAPADIHYPLPLKEKINQAIAQKIKEILAAYDEIAVCKINNENISLVSDEVYFHLLKNPHLKEKINQNALDAFKKEYHAVKYLSSHIQDKLLKVYRLAQVFAWEEEIEKIAKLVKDLVYYALLTLIWTSIKDYIAFQPQQNTFIKIIEFLKSLGDDYKDCCCKEINRVIEHLFKEARTLTLAPNQYLAFIHAIEKKSLLSTEHKQFIDEFYEQITNHSFSDYCHYACIAKYIGKENDAKQKLISWLNENPNCFEVILHTCDFPLELEDLIALNNALPLNKQDNQDLFTLIIKNLETSRFHLRVGYYLHYFRASTKPLVELIMNLKTCQGDLTTAQIEIILPSFANIAQEYLEHLSHQSADKDCGFDIYVNFIYLLEDIELFINKDLQAFMPSCLIESFNCKLPEIVASRGLWVFNKYHLMLIKKLHHRLSIGKESRADIIEKILQARADRLAAQNPAGNTTKLTEEKEKEKEKEKAVPKPLSLPLTHQNAIQLQQALLTDKKTQDKITYHLIATEAADEFKQITAVQENDASLPVTSLSCSLNFTETSEEELIKIGKKNINNTLLLAFDPDKNTDLAAAIDMIIEAVQISIDDCLNNEKGPSSTYFNLFKNNTSMHAREAHAQLKLANDPYKKLIVVYALLNSKCASQAQDYIVNTFKEILGEPYSRQALRCGIKHLLNKIAKNNSDIKDFKSVAKVMFQHLNHHQAAIRLEKSL